MAEPSRVLTATLKVADYLGAWRNESPQYNLRDIKAAFATVRSLRITKSAADTALTFGISLEAIVEIIAEMTGEQFYKSMTSIANVRIWQDVYHVNYASLVLYIKFTKDPDGHLLVSFKER